MVRFLDPEIVEMVNKSYIETLMGDQIMMRARNYIPLIVLTRARYDMPLIIMRRARYDMPAIVMTRAMYDMPLISISQLNIVQVFIILLVFVPVFPHVTDHLCPG